MNLVLVGGVTFLAAAVEWVEALTIVLAVGLFKGWRSAFIGTVLALVALIGLILVFGVGLASIIPIEIARTLVGVFLLLFGLKWLHKAILRSSGLKALHDEAKVFEEEKKFLLEHGEVNKRAIDPVGTVTSFNGVFLEGLEVVFIVIALGATSLNGAVIGAIASLVVVVIVGAVFRSPLTRVPENTMKYVVGIMLTAFGTFFAGEGVGVNWWHADVSLLWLIAVYAVGSLILVQILKRPPSTEPRKPGPILRAVRGIAMEAWGLFVGDSALALVVIVVLFAIALYANLRGQHDIAAYLLVAGIIGAIIVGVVEPYRKRTKELRAAASSAKEVRSGGSAGAQTQTQVAAASHSPTPAP
jgi:Ca2+/H+ antiporter, TMEM165/GDT1 family